MFWEEGAPTSGPSLLSTHLWRHSVLWRDLRYVHVEMPSHMYQLYPHLLQTVVSWPLLRPRGKYISDMVCPWEGIIILEALSGSQKISGLFRQEVIVSRCLYHGSGKEEDRFWWAHTLRFTDSLPSEAEHSQRRSSKAWILEKRISCLCPRPVPFLKISSICPPAFVSTSLM